VIDHVTIHNLFPTPLYVTELDLDQFTLNRDDFTVTEAFHEGTLAISDDRNILENDRFVFLKEMIDDHANHFYHNIAGYSTNATLYMSSSWIVYSAPGHKSLSHTHSNSFLSGVLYVDTPENCGDIIFELSWNDDRRWTGLFEPDISNHTPYNSVFYPIKVRKGMLLLFPSSLKHLVLTNESNKDRISIAFNYFLRGVFNTSGAKLFIK